jgi:hypothetical protein
VSGFDFDALRDPVAPDPGSRERALVEARARQLRARNRRTRIVLSATSLVAVVAIVAGVVAVTHQTGPTVTVENPSTTLPPATTPTTAGPSVDGRFIPPTTMENGLVTLPVTFPSGETTTLRYPPAMKIAQLGFGGGVGVGYPVTSGALRCCGKVVSIRYTTIQHLYGDAKPIKVYRGANGEAVPFFHGYQSVPPVTAQLDYLVFQFGPWLVQVYDVRHSGDFELRMTDAQRAMWARSLTGTTDSSGYLVLHAQAPLSVDNGLESGFGADPGNRVELDPHLYCDQPESDTAHRRPSNSNGTFGLSWCVNKELHVAASGSASFAVEAGALQVDPLGTPLTRTTTPTTTTTLPPHTAIPAESASFVSADQGWVLQRDAGCSHDPCRSRIAHTTDGGKTWQALSVVGRLPYSTQIRFADALHGFAFTTTANAGAASLLESKDGGKHLRRLVTPFSNISDLTISDGIVYVVGIPSGTPTNGAFPGFRIWSAPVDDLNWKMDPLVIPTGAGPVPEQQLVFAGSSGWLINSDRGVVSGARFSSTTGRWAEWTPPCKDVNGSASLSASTSTDLVAVCSPGFATDSKITYIEFSHDAGATFRRRAGSAHRGHRRRNGTAANDRRRRDVADRREQRRPDAARRHLWLRGDGRLRVHDADAGIHRDGQRELVHDVRRRRDLEASDAAVRASARTSNTTPTASNTMRLV